MENITLLDTAIGSTNKGDEIIMKCVEEELNFFLKKHFVLKVATHLCSFNALECLGNLPDTASEVYNSKYKIVCGTNLLSNDMLHRTNQWDINYMNCKPLIGSILVGVGGSGGKISRYTSKLYKKVLSHNYIHSVRDQRAYDMLTELGFKCINTGCITMWKLTPEFCELIPKSKRNKVIFTLTDYQKNKESDKRMIKIIRENYDELFFWIQGVHDYDYLNEITDISDIRIIGPDVGEYEKVLQSGDIDYIGTRLHAGIYAMRHGIRSIIVCVDTRMDAMANCIPNNTLERANIDLLADKITSTFSTRCEINRSGIEEWKMQFVE